MKTKLHYGSFCLGIMFGCMLFCVIVSSFCWVRLRQNQVQPNAVAPAYVRDAKLYDRTAIPLQTLVMLAALVDPSCSGSVVCVAIDPMQKGQKLCINITFRSGEGLVTERLYVIPELEKTDDTGLPRFECKSVPKEQIY